MNESEIGDYYTKGKEILEELAKVIHRQFDKKNKN